MTTPAKPRATRKPHAAPRKRPSQTAALQAAVEQAAQPSDTIEFEGEKYKIASQVGIWPLMQFARAAESGVDVLDMRALAAMHAFLQDCLDPADWGRFQENMIRTKQADPDKLLGMASKVVEQLTSRPTQPPSGSSNGQSAPSDGSKAESSLPVAAG